MRRLTSIPNSLAILGTQTLLPQHPLVCHTPCLEVCFPCWHRKGVSSVQTIFWPNRLLLPPPPPLLPNNLLLPNTTETWEEIIFALRWRRSPLGLNVICCNLMYLFVIIYLIQISQALHHGISELCPPDWDFQYFWIKLETMLFRISKHLLHGK